MSVPVEAPRKTNSALKTGITAVGIMVIAVWVLCRLANLSYMVLGNFAPAPAFWAGLLLDTIGAGLAGFAIVVARKNLSNALMLLLGGIAIMTFFTDLVSSVLNQYSFIDGLPYVTPIIDIYYDFLTATQYMQMVSSDPTYILIILGWTISPAILQTAALVLVFLLIRGGSGSASIAAQAATAPLVVPQAPSGPMQYSAGAGTPAAPKFDPMTGKPLDH